MRLEEQAVDKLEALIRDGDADGLRDPLVALIRGRKYRIVFGIVTRKDPAGRSQNLPLFSRISLMRGMKTLHLMDVPGSVIFVSDETAAGEGKKKKRKKKGPVDAPAPEVAEAA